MSDDKSDSVGKFPRSIACPQCKKGKLELICIGRIETDRIFYALCTHKACDLHLQKVPLFLYEKYAKNSSA